jgi:hypothetical protein
MAPETCQKFLALLDGIVQGMGGGTWETLIESFRHSVELLRPTGILGLIRQTVRDLRMMDRPIDEVLAEIDTREKMASLLGRMPEPEPSVLAGLLRSGKISLPTIRTVLIEGATQLPPDPGGRRQKFPTEEDRERVCTAIKKLRYADIPLCEAQQMVAAQENAGLSTVQKVWRKRRRGPGPPTRTKMA